jgi:hypothetical protein
MTRQQSRRHLFASIVIGCSAGVLCFLLLKYFGLGAGDFALLTIPGPLLLLALHHWRERDAPILWLIPKTRKEVLYTATVSWVAYVWYVHRTPMSTEELRLICVLFFYLPMLVIVLTRKR